MAFRIAVMLVAVGLSAGCASCGDPEEPNNTDPNVITEDPDMGTPGTDMQIGQDASADIGTVDMEPPPPAPTLELGREELVLRAQQSQQLEAWILFEEEMFEAEGLTWTSGNESIVTVSAEGLAMAQSVEGNTNILARATFMEDSVETTLPVTVITPFISIAAGGQHSCATTQAGSLYCWGDNGSGQLALTGRNTAARPTGGPAGAELVRVAAGESHSCAIDVDGAVWCWGDNSEKQGGAGGASLDEPTAVGLPNIGQLALGDAFSCAMEQESLVFPDRGAIFCWGSNAEGQLGVSSVATNTEIPVRVDVGGTPTTWRNLTAGRRHVCATTTGGETYCWGDNREDQLGPQPAVQQSDEPLLVGTGFQAVAAGGTQTCALKSGVVECWGTATGGLAPGVTNSADPVEVPAPGTGRATRLSVGDGFACASSADGMFCWGANERGQLGDTTTDSRDTAAFVNGSPSFLQFSSGGAHVCALNDTGGAFCWGANDRNQIGDLDDVDRRSPAVVALPRTP